MADDSWPGPNHNSRAVTSAELDLLLSAYVPNGLVGSPADLDIIYCDSSGLNVKVRAGRYAIVRGRIWYSGASALTVSLAANGTGSDRYDLIVLRYNRTTYDVRADKVTGTPGSGIPSPVNDASYFDFPLGHVLVTPGAVATDGTDAKVTTYYLGSSLFTAESNYAPPVTAFSLVAESDTGKLKAAINGSWVTLHQDSNWTSRSPSTGFTIPSGGYGVRFRAVGAQAFMHAQVQRVNALAANSRAVFVTFDAQYAPSERLPVALWVAADSGPLTVVSGKVTVPSVRVNAAIQANGTITMDAHPALDAGALVMMPLTSWPID